MDVRKQMRLNIGKFRRLTQTSSQQGTFTILALDHRQNLYKAFNPSHPETVPSHTLIEFKKQVVRELAPHASAVLLDPEVGAAQAIASNSLPGNTGLLVAVEATGYKGNRSLRFSNVLPGWNIGKIARMGGAGAKLLIYYHPDAPNARQQEALIMKVAGDCKCYDLPLFLEPITYSLDPSKKNLPVDEKKQVVIETANRLSELGADVLKIEFPIDANQESDQRVWMKACAELTRAVKIPWALLSAGIDYSTFLQQARVACQAGASGVIAGRAIWGEAVELDRQARINFLRTTAVERLKEIKQECDTLGKSFTEYYPEYSVDEGWYKEYEV
jgi:tagatose 1,6-diphosphate aldolase